MAHKADVFPGRSRELTKLEDVSGDWLDGKVDTVCGGCSMPGRTVEC